MWVLGRLEAPTPEGATVDVQVGYVTTRKNRRLHLALHGLAACGAGSGRILGPAFPLTPGHTGTLCRRCLHRTRALVHDTIGTYLNRPEPWARARVHRLSDVLYNLETPEQAAAAAQAMAVIAARLSTPQWSGHVDQWAARHRASIENRIAAAVAAAQALSA